MWLPPVLDTPPATEPLTPEDVATYLRIDSDDYDGLIPRWLTAAREKVEKLTATRLITQTVMLQATDLGDLAQLPIGPVQSLVSVDYLDTPSSAWPDLASYELVGGGLSWALIPTAGTLPAPRVITAAIAPIVSVTLVVGYGAAEADVPGNVLIAILETVRGLMNNVPVDVAGWLVDDRLWL